jgi:hypothetical protein
MSKRIGINWYVKQRQRIEALENKLLKLEIQNRTLKKILSEYYGEQYEDNNTGSTGNGKDNNVIEFSGRIYPTRD